MDSNSLSTRVKQIIDTASFNGVEIVVHNQIGVLNKYLPYCVLGVLCTKEGLKIEKYLLSSLLFRYRVICVRQCPPGVLTEYPALRIAQRLSMECNIPVLYLHTKGAYNKHPTQSRIVNMWIDEFVRKKSLYGIKLSDYDLLAPFCSYQRIAWGNGFIATPSAFSSIGQIYQSTDRYVYERLFFNTSIRYWGHINDNIVRELSKDNTNEMFQYINSTYSKRRSHICCSLRIIYNQIKKIKFVRTFIETAKSKVLQNKY